MVILFFSKNEQAGWELQRTLVSLGDVIALDCEGEGGFVGDLTDIAGIRATVAAVSPDFDRAENVPELAHQVNEAAPKALAEEAAACNIWLVYYSTDYALAAKRTGMNMLFLLLTKLVAGAWHSKSKKSHLSFQAIGHRPLCVP
ncbi:MAG: sugar nucleotide-binding protein [Azoarcus sp.]|jgi:dTDP-4-dehydrorhamnose reductase|nr:sugar nucleotide-binding protein [Azoarcus sp.]